MSLSPPSPGHLEGLGCNEETWGRADLTVLVNLQWVIPLGELCWLTVTVNMTQPKMTQEECIILKPRSPNNPILEAEPASVKFSVCIPRTACRGKDSNRSTQEGFLDSWIISFFHSFHLSFNDSCFSILPFLSLVNNVKLAYIIKSIQNLSLE